MSYSKDQIEVAIKATWLRFFRSVLLTSIVGAIGIYYITQNTRDDISLPSALFGGFIVGFATAGIVIPHYFRNRLYKQQ